MVSSIRVSPIREKQGHATSDEEETLAYALMKRWHATPDGEKTSNREEFLTS
jgi:hypothetical protein